MAASTDSRFAVVFDGGGGSNGFVNSAYLNLRSNTGESITLNEPVVLTVDVVALSGTGENERNMGIGSSNGQIERGSYNPTTRTTTVTWTIPAGTVVPVTEVAPANPDILFSFRDGGLNNRIRNKIVVRSIYDAEFPRRVSPVIDSSVVRDYDQGAVSPDGIY